MDDKEKQQILAQLKPFRLADVFARTVSSQPAGSAAQESAGEQEGMHRTESQEPGDSSGSIGFEQGEETAGLDAKQMQYVQEARQDCDDIIVRSNWQDLEFEITERRSNLALNIRGKKIEFKDPKVLADHLREAQSMILNTDREGQVYMMINWIDENAYISSEDHPWM